MTTYLQLSADVVASIVVPSGTRLSDGTYVTLKGMYYEPNPDLTGYYLQHYDANGDPLGDPVLLFTDGYEDMVAGIGLLALPDGGFELAVSYDSFDYDFHEYVLSSFSVQHYTADGVKVGDSYNQNTFWGPYGNVQMVLLDSGNILTVATNTNDFDGERHNLQILTPEGSLVGGLTSLVYDQDIGHRADVSATAIDGGGFVVAWTAQSGSGDVAYGQVFNGAGVAVSASFPLFVSTSIDQHVFTAERWNDGFVLAGSVDGVTRLQAYDADGTAHGNVVALGSVGRPQITELSDGGFVAVWSGADSDGNGVLAQRFDAEAYALGPVLLVNHHTAGQQAVVDVVATANGGFSVTWYGDGDSGNGTYHTDFAATGSLWGKNYAFGTWDSDVLNGGNGADVMVGGTGNDTYYVDHDGDQTLEDADGGTDLVKASLSWSLGANLEDLVLTGSGNINGYGNGLDNHITGNTGANVLIGGDGNDTLYGGAGNDTMSGGAGNDTYYVDALGDRVDESLGGEMDTVRSSVDFSMGAGIENLTLTGTGNLRAFGNDLNNAITGTSGANVLLGRGGNDVLNGGAGADRLYGGTGNDTFYVDDAGDRVYEAAGEGYDRVLSSVSFGINSQSIEYVILTGTADIDASGNIGNDRLLGNAGANTLKGGDGDDRLDGGTGNDILIGGRGADMFVFGLHSGTDTIRDYRADQNDRIDLRAFGGNSLIHQEGADTIIQVLMSGATDPLPDVTILVQNTVYTDVLGHILL